MIYQAVILIWAGGQQNCIFSLLPYRLPHFVPGFPEFLPECLLGLISRCNSLFCVLPGNMKRFFHVGSQLSLPVLLPVPVEQGRVKWDLPPIPRIIRIPHNDRISFYHRTHGLTGLLLIF